MSRSFIQKIAHFIGPDRDISAPDVDTNARTMSWMMDEYSKIVGNPSFGVITGKPLSIGGSEGRKDAIARGGWYIIGEVGKCGRKCGIPRTSLV